MHYGALRFFFCLSEHNFIQDSHVISDYSPSFLFTDGNEGNTELSLCSILRAETVFAKICLWLKKKYDSLRTQGTLR